MDGLADKVSAFVVGNDFAKLPPDVVEAAKAAFLDCVGVALAGSEEESARICGALAQQEARVGDATVIGQGFRTSATMAALCNGTSAHALDYDHSFLMGQPTAGLIPAVLSMGETLGVSGRNALAAYVAGFEWCRGWRVPCRSFPPRLTGTPLPVSEPSARRPAAPGWPDWIPSACATPSELPLPWHRESYGTSPP